MRKLILFGITLFLTGGAFAQNLLKAYAIKDVPEGVAIELEFSEGVPEFRHFTLANPPRIVVDLQNVAYGLGEKIFVVGRNGIQRMRGAQYQKDPVPIARIVLDVDSFRTYTVSQSEGKLVILVGGLSEAPYKSEAPEQSTNVEQAKTAEQPKKPSYKVEFGEKYFYSSRGKKDPFQPESLPGGEELLNVSEAKLLGIIKTDEGNIALLQDRRGVGYVLKEGDRVRNGRVVRIESDRVIFATVDFGFTRIIELKLEEEQK